MAGIFNLFGGTGGATHAAKQQSSFGPTDSSIKSTMKPTIFGNARIMAGKNSLLTPSKSKGLSMRSTSELNVVRSNGNGERSPRKKSPSKTFARAYFGPSECVSLPVSPRNKSLKLQMIKSKQHKALSSKSKSPSNSLTNEMKQAEDTIFKKPLALSYPSRRIMDPYPEPDILAFHYDDRNAFDCTVDTLDREFVEFLRVSKAPIKPYDDEGFESDTEPISEPIPNSVDSALNDYSFKAETFELPALSDDDDFLD